MPLEKVKNNKPPTKDEIKGRLIFGLIMIIGSILLVLFLSYPKYKMAKETLSWPTTQGEITEVTILAHKDGVHQRFHSLEHYDREEGIRFRLIPYYKYTIDANSYENSRIHLMQSKKEGKKRLKYARREMKELMKNPMVTVSYNPADPQDALLEPGLRFGTWFFIIASPLILLVAGVPVTYSGIKQTLFQKK